MKHDRTLKHWSEETRLIPLVAARKKIVCKLERAYSLYREDECDYLHDQLVSIEWRIQQAERQHG